MEKVTEKIQKIINELDELDEYYESLNYKLSDIDLKIQDLLHYLEYNKIRISWIYRYVSELQKLRLERRQIKNDIFILSKFNENKNKLIGSKNRTFLVNEIHKAEKQLESPYKNRQYSDDELNNLLKISNKKE